jgi:hypothetical protein
VTSIGRRRLCLVVQGCLLVALIALALRSGDWAVEVIARVGADRADPMRDWRLWAALAVYVALMAIPFCPGIEVGLALLALFGAQVAPAVYLATVFALLLAFVVGRFVPQAVLVSGFDALGMRRAGDLMRRVQALSPAQRLGLTPLLAGKWGQRLVRHRHAALAVALNLPGNIVLGDGGGIALAAGLSRLYTLPAFMVTVLIAVAPVPLAIMVAGS